MAELNQKSVPVANKKVRVRKAAPKVDLTAMVDLAFLLITFFMLTTSLNKPHSLDVAMPDKTSEPHQQDMDERRVVSLLVGESTISWYHGNLQNPLSAPETVQLEPNGLRQVLVQMKNTVPQIAEGKDLVILIKPSKEARAIDIIHTLDEMKISDIKRYLISKISPDEEDIVLASNM